MTVTFPSHIAKAWLMMGLKIPARWTKFIPGAAVGRDAVVMNVPYCF